MRIKTLRSNIESIPSTPNKLSATHYSRFNDSEFDNFALSPEILSEKLYDSVKMIRDLMNSNKKLKETINEISQQKKIIEIENIQLNNDNQDLLERLENAENNNNQKAFETIASRELIKAKKEKERLIRKITELEDEKKIKNEANSSKRNWSWKSKRTILKNHRHSQDPRVLPVVTADRKNHRQSIDDHSLVRTYRPLSQDFAMDSTKQEAIATLSKILMKGIPY